MQFAKMALGTGLFLGATVGSLFSGWFSCKHKETTLTVVQTAACELQGINHYVCARCDEVISEEVLPAMGHEYTSYAIIKKPSKDKDGTKMRWCTKCGIEEMANMVCPHEDYSFEVVREATCRDEGIKLITCSDCGTTEERPIPVLEHAETAIFVTADATCSLPGEKSHICTTCFSVAYAEDIPATEHTYGDWMLDTYATPSKDGSRYRICHTCGYKDSQSYSVELEDKTLYIPSMNVRCPFAVGMFTQKDVNANDVLYTNWAYAIEDINNPFILGHNYGSLGTLYELKIGEHVYVQLDGIVYDYKVVVSEYAVEYGGVDQIGQTTGVNIWDTYSSGLSSGESYYRRETDSTNRWAEDDGMTLHMYTCYYGSSKPEWEPSHRNNGRWIVIADLVEKYPVGELIGSEQ